MASLLSATGELQLDFRLLRTTLDPFQQDLEWFEYELSVAVAAEDEAPEAAARGGTRRRISGKLNRQEFNALLRAFEDLLQNSQPLRFEPADLNFFLDWSHETPSVYLLIVWFDLSPSSRSLEQRFPGAHAGFRFLADRASLLGFRQQLENEFRQPTPRGAVVR